MSLQLLTLQQPQQPKSLFGEQKSTLPTETDDLFKTGMATNPIVLKQDNPVDDKRYSAIYGTKVTVLPGYLTGTASMPRGSTVN
jgi:hypothetical protein